MLARLLVVVLLAGTRPAAAQLSAAPAPVRADSGMVVAAERHAAAAGVEVLRAGGNAVDAAVATGFALAVTFPVAGNLGGGGFLVVRFPDGRAATLDFRETAPAAATRDMFLDDAGRFVPALSQRGALASGVPGSVAGLLDAHARWGRLPRAAVLAPAIRLAREGVRLSPGEADLYTALRADFLAAGESTARAFTRETAYRAGDLFVQADLARTLDRVAERGRDGFYRGETARLLVAQQARGGGLITLADLAGYRPALRPAVEGRYRGRRVISMGPPSSGGIALVQMLAALEPHDLRAGGFHSSATVHRLAETMRRAYADRAEWLGDPDVFDVPAAGLLDSAYVAARMADVRPHRATPSDSVSHGAPARTAAGRPEATETTHYSVVDAEGTAVSVTTTLNGAFGSLVVVDGAGFFLNNEMDDFAAAPGVPNMFGLVGGEANAVGPGKRPLSSMTPTILEDERGRLSLVVGSPGGARIITAVLQTILGVVDFGLTVQEAVAAPRVHHQWLPDRIEAERFALAADVVAALEARGHTVRQVPGRWARVDAIHVVYDAVDEAVDPSGLARTQAARPGRLLLGGADPRGEDAAVGY